MWSFSEVRGRKSLITSKIMNQSKRDIAHRIDREAGGFKTIYTVTCF